MIYSGALEQRIMECWNVVTDLKAIYTHIQDNRELNTDELSNLLMGMEHLYQIKFELLFSTFEQHLKAAHENLHTCKPACDKGEQEERDECPCHHSEEGSEEYVRSSGEDIWRE